MAIVALNCPNCGGPIQKEDKSCKYCLASINFSPDYKQVKLVGFPCPKCGNPAEKGDRFCSKCAVGLVIKCASCRHDVPLGSVFCPKCRTNFAVVKLIEEANHKKQQTNDIYDTKDKQLMAERDNVYQSYRAWVNREADSLIAKATSIGDQKFLIGLGYFGIFVLAGMVDGILVRLSQSFAEISLFAWMGLFIGGVFLAKRIYPPMVKDKGKKALLATAAEMKKDWAWQQYIPDVQRKTLAQKDKDTEENKNKLTAERSQEIKRIDEWLDSTVSTLHS